MAPVALKQAAGIAERAGLRNEQVPKFRSVLEDVLGFELAAARSAFTTERAFRAWIEAFYGPQQERVREELEPVVRSYGEQVSAAALAEVESTDAPFDQALVTRQYTEAAAARWTGDSVGQLRQVLRDEEGEDLEEEIGARFARWEETRAQQTAEREATQAGGAFAKLAFFAAGASQLVWRTVGESCPLCESMNGRTVEITRPFLDVGDEVEGQGREGPQRLVTEQRIGHPPLHGMGGKGGVCDCIIAAA